MEKTVAVLGVGYVGLQSALSFAKSGVQVIAFDISTKRIKELAAGVDNNQEVSFCNSDNLFFTDDPKELSRANYYLISVPTPLNQRKVPDVHALKEAAKLVAQSLKKNDVVILESTVFPGATRELLIPILEAKTSLISGYDFFAGYSSERIDPGNEVNTFINTTKVISGQNSQALLLIKELYEQIPGIKLFAAASMEAAESSKLLENIQRNVNIALMNEFAQIMNEINVSIYDVLAASRTKWNFMPFTPGLVGGHCIPEDPHYLIYQANKSDSVHRLISTACETNQQFYHYIIHVTLKLLARQDIALNQAKIAILGMTFKPNVKDMRHSLSLNIYQGFKSIGLRVVACDPLVDTESVDLNWESLQQLNSCHVVLMCQAHKAFIQLGPEQFSEKINPYGLFMDIPGAFVTNRSFREDIQYWCL